MGIDSNFFKVNSNIITNLGEELIKNETVAIVEMIKNSYDADATKVIINFVNIHKPNEGYIEIIDNGLGMNEENIINNWLEIGLSHKKDHSKTLKYKRFPLGEKGIGRFGAHKLGNKIEIFSKKEFNNEIYTVIDWNNFSQDKYLDEIPITVETENSNYFSNKKHGTIIKISKLKKQWTAFSFSELYDNLNLIYYSNREDFEIEIKINVKEWELEFKNRNKEKYKSESLFSVSAEIENNQIKELNYTFKPYSNLKELSLRTEIEKNTELKDEKNNLIDLTNFKIGKFKIQLEIYDLDYNLLNLAEFKKENLKQFLKLNSGIKIYKDNIKVNEYGDQDNDWLKLDIRRVNQPTKRLSNNIVIGSIFLDAEKSQDLKEKTNREGFIENEAFKKFKEAILIVISKVENFRFIDKQLLRTLYSKKRKKESIYNSLDLLKNSIKDSSLSKFDKKNIFGEIIKIENDIEEKTSILLKSSNIGLGIAVAVHEIEKISIEIKREINNLKSCSEELKSLVDNLVYIINSYRDLLQKSSIRKAKIKNLIDKVYRIMNYRFKKHNVLLETVFFDDEKVLSLAPNLILGSLLNILDNALWWLENKNISNKKIIIKTEYNDKFISVLIADNGKGFEIEPRLAVQPFVSKKINGIGLGLYIVFEIMEMHKGILSFPSFEEANLPEEYLNGAIIKLDFPILQGE